MSAMTQPATGPGVTQRPPPRSAGRLPTVIGIAIAVLVLALIAAHFSFEAFVVSGRVRPGLRTAFGVDLATALPLTATAVVGAVIIARQPRNRIGWLALAAALGGTLQTWTAVDYAAFGIDVSPGTVPVPLLPLWLGQLSPFVVFGLYVVILPLIFPDGRLLSSRWRWALVAYAAALVLAIPTLFDPIDLQSYGVSNPYSNPALAGYVANVPSTLLFIACFLGSAIAALISLVKRYQAAASELQHQMRWLIPAGVVTLGGLAVVALGSPQKGQPEGIVAVVAPLAATTLPVAVAFAVLKYRLYDIDIVINRALVYGALAVFITAIYVGLAVGVGALIGSDGKPNLALSVLATAIVAIGFQPVRERIQRVANRLVYGNRATPYEVLSQFSERVAESYASDEVLPRMARLLGEGTGAELAEVWLRSGDTLRCAAASPAEQKAPMPVRLERDANLTVPHADRTAVVRHQGELLGALAVTKRRGESLTPIEIKLMDDLAHQAGLVLKNVGLTADLQARLDDLQASRQRLVAAQDDERRRLERNLHDGAQQHLVAIKVKLGLAEMFATRDPAKAIATIVDLKRDADEALETLRDLARGIYPPLLADQGLAAALRSQANKATLPVHVDAGGVGRYPQETEAALYFCTLEALQNVQKYAAASAVEVLLHEHGEELHVEITDDGQGFDVSTATRGAGLTNMEDRLDALGGSLQIESTPGVGTTLRATVPIPLAALATT
jgi:signal transduction histidine kinase